MRGNAVQRMQLAQRAFRELVAPAVIDVLGGGKLTPVELAAGGRELDVVAGIDYWHLDTARGQMFGLAVRIQDGVKHNRPNFTVRKTLTSGNATEYDKRVRQMQSGAIRPMWACQAYIDFGRWCLLRGAVAPQDKLIELAPRIGYELVNREDGNTFLSVAWSGLKQCGVDVRVFTNQGDLFPGL